MQREHYGRSASFTRPAFQLFHETPTNPLAASRLRHHDIADMHDRARVEVEAAIRSWGEPGTGQPDDDALRIGNQQET